MNISSYLWVGIIGDFIMHNCTTSILTYLHRLDIQALINITQKLPKLGDSTGALDTESS